MLIRMGLATKMLVMVLSLVLLIIGFLITFSLIKGSVQPLDLINRVQNLFTMDYYMIFIVVILVLFFFFFVLILLKERFKI